MPAIKFVLFFRNEINHSLLLYSANRIGGIVKVKALKKDLSKLEGINFFKEWENLFTIIMKLWEEDPKAPILKLDENLLDKLAFFLDFIAQLFLHNGSGSEEDKDYFKNVDTFFQQHKKQRGEGSTQNLFDKAFK
jgi:hypothetical protein